jgi:hypothetical protein
VGGGEKWLELVPRKRRANAEVVIARRLPGEWYWRRDGKEVDAAATIADEATTVAKAIA